MSYREKDQDVTFRLCRVNLKHCCDSGMQVVCFGLRCVMNINGIPSVSLPAAWRKLRVHTVEYWGIVKVCAELLGIHGCTGY
jgi:hypothetical protein